jgi:hypothetical protein
MSCRRCERRRTPRAFDRIDGAGDEDSYRHILRGEMAHYLKTGHHRHLDVEEQEVGAKAFSFANGFATVLAGVQDFYAVEFLE